MVDRPKTRYARSGDVSIAYQVLGEGPLHLVLVPGWVSHVEWAWEEPGLARLLERLAGFSRLVIFDKRGTGMSDRVANDHLPPLEERMDDLRAVMDAVGIAQAAVFGISEGGPLSLLFAATYPERTRALITLGSYARWLRDEDHPWTPSRSAHEHAMAMVAADWGGPVGLPAFAPSVADDPDFRRWWAAFLRRGASPGAAIALYRMNIEVDVRHLLPLIQVPTLLLHRTGDRIHDVRSSRYMAERIPGAKLVELEGNDHLPWVGNVDEIVGEIQEFLTGVREQPPPQRVLTTVLFVDIVDSTVVATRVGDHAWSDLLAHFHRSAERDIARFRGRLVDTAGDGFLACFDGPARAVRCAMAARDATAALGMAVRAGVHSGECELLGDKPSGIAVHLGSRIAGTAAAGEILVSSTVKDLVAGSGLAFADRGQHRLKGIDQEWRLYSVLDSR